MVDRQVTRFMKGVFELRTPLPKYTTMWDVGILLDIFRRQNSNKKLSLQELTFKLCALLLLTTAQRIQTIHLICLSWIDIKNQDCVIQIMGKLKHTKPGKVPGALEFYMYEDEKRCGKMFGGIYCKDCNCKKWK